MYDKMLSNREIEKMSTDERLKYFEDLKSYCLGLKSSNVNNTSICQSFVHKIVPRMRKYDFEVRGKENIPSDGRALFVVNHSNSHDFYTMEEAFKEVGLDISFFASNENLNPLVINIFKSCKGVLIDRRDKGSVDKGTLEFISNIVSGRSGVIYGESTWNMHPYKPMQLIKLGSAHIAAVADAPIIPTIYEYVEVPYTCTKEGNIYSKCIVKFCEPIYISRTQNLVTQTNVVQSSLEQNRLDLWSELGTIRTSLDDVNPEVYLNHTYLKKFCAFAYTYDSESEAKFLLSKDKQPVENEYHIDEFGNFVPGVTDKIEGKKYVYK